MHRYITPIFLILAAAGLGMNGSEPRAAGRQADCSVITAANIDDCVRMNQIQTIGTHNSYHLAPEPALMAWMGDRARNIDYSHRPLAEQLETLGIRQIELDVFADPDGGRYATPAAFRLVEGLVEPPSADLAAPGFKVLHGQDVDYRTTCATLVACLTEVRDWSRANPTHVPILVLIEAKDGEREDPDGIGYVQPVPIGTREFRALDEEIRSVFPADHLLTPVDVRGDHPSLNEAIRIDGWPTLREVRGRVLFALDNTDEHREAYLASLPVDERVLFVSAPAGHPHSAFLKLNEATGGNEAEIRTRVSEGYLVRTRADIPTDEARTGSTARQDAAFRTGAQYVSTDYPEASPFGSGYVARLPGAEALAARCNPVNAPDECRSEWLEP